MKFWRSSSQDMQLIIEQFGLDPERGQNTHVW